MIIIEICYITQLPNNYLKTPLTKAILSSDPLGLIFHRIISYLAKLRSRRRQYQMGLKQLGEHMHVVTRTISNPPSATATPVATPSISLRKLAHLNTSNNNNNNNKKGTLGAVAALHSTKGMYN